MDYHYDDAETVYITTKDHGEVEVHVGIFAGSGHWEYWSDTGYEFCYDSDAEGEVGEAYRKDGEPVALTENEESVAIEKAIEVWWERYANNMR